MTTRLHVSLVRLHQEDDEIRRVKTNRTGIANLEQVSSRSEVSRSGSRAQRAYYRVSTGA